MEEVCQQDFQFLEILKSLPKARMLIIEDLISLNDIKYDNRS